MKSGHAEIVGAGFGGPRRRHRAAPSGLDGPRSRAARHRCAAKATASPSTTTWRTSSPRSAFSIGCWPGGMKIDRRDSLDATGRVVMRRKTTRSPYRIDRQHIIALLGECARECGVDIRFELDRAIRARSRRRGDACGRTQALRPTSSSPPTASTRRFAKRSACSTGASGAATAACASPSPDGPKRSPPTIATAPS